MRVLVVGATGGIGLCVVRQGLARGLVITALARKPEAIDINDGRLRVAKGDVLDPRTLDAVMGGQDVVISALGTADRKSKIRSEGMANVLASMKKHRARRIVAVSSCGVGDSEEQAKKSAFVFGRIIMPLLLKNVFADMAKMEALIRESNLEFVIARPVELTDKPATKKVTAVTDGSKVGSKIPRADVAEFLLDRAVGGEFLGKAVSIFA